MISRAIHTLDVNDVQWDVAHLFEHLLIHAWHAYLVDNNYNPSLYGWVQGETFEEYLFIDAGFYDTRTASLFGSFIGTRLQFSSNEIDKSLAEIGAEEKSKFSIIDKQHLQQDIALLSNRLLSGKDNKENTHKSDICLDSKKMSKRYRDITLLISGNDLSKTEQIVFLRLRTIVIDIVSHALKDKYVCYEQGSSALVRNNQDMGYISNVTLETGQAKRRELAAYLTSSVQQFQVEKGWSQIEMHLKVFAEEPLWKDVSIEYYRETGILTSPSEIAMLATKEVILSIFSKVTIEAIPHDKNSDQWIR